ncbi:MAG: hypothetical protein ACK6DC_01165, partial [Planctomycetota bacterium]
MCGFARCHALRASGDAQTRQQTYDGLGQLKYLVSRTVYDDFGRTILTTDSYLEGSADPIYGSQTL